MSKETKLESVKSEMVPPKKVELRKQIEAISQENRVLRATIEKLKNVIVSREVELFDRRCSPAPKPTGAD